MLQNGLRKLAREAARLHFKALAQSKCGPPMPKHCFQVLPSIDLLVEARTLRLLAVCSNQLNYETFWQLDREHASCSASILRSKALLICSAAGAKHAGMQAWGTWRSGTASASHAARAPWRSGGGGEVNRWV